MRRKMEALLVLLVLVFVGVALYNWRAVVQEEKQWEKERKANEEEKESD